jgi:hypothetical protein
VPETRIFRYEVPVDDCWHAHDLYGEVLHVAGRSLLTVEFWAMRQGESPRRREFRIFGTGQPLDGGQYLGTVVHPSLVWHLFARDVAGGV